MWVVDIEPSSDERGMFARVWCADEFGARGLPAAWCQISTSRNTRAGTLRGMHWQEQPHSEAKLVRVTAGSIFDVTVDVRAGSPSRGTWFGVTLSADTHRALYIPPGFAHGFITLEENSEILYHIDAPFVPESARGFRWDDPRVSIRWPMDPVLMSPRDASLPPLDG